MIDRKYLLWETVKKVIDGKEPESFFLIEGVDVCLHILPEKELLFVDVPIDKSSYTPDFPEMTDIHFSRIIVDGDDFIRMALKNKFLSKEFYSLSVAISNNVLDYKTEPLKALLETLGSFKHLLKTKKMLSQEVLVGLIGELWVLRSLLVEIGPSVLSSWVGPEGQAHDFRYKDFEIEVKTTRSDTRQHVISKLDQLRPSVDKKLYLLSLQIGEADETGFSLESIVNDCYELLKSDANKKLLSEKISLILDMADKKVKKRFSLRSEAMILKVDDKTPKITSDVLREGLTIDQLARISSVEYTINVTGMGFNTDENAIIKNIDA